MKNLTDWVPKEEIFNKDFVWPRQMEIHLPANKEIACDFHCFYCQGSKLDMGLGLDEKKALKLTEEIGPNTFDYGMLGKQPEIVEEFKEMIKIFQDKEFHCHNCIHSME